MNSMIPMSTFMMAALPAIAIGADKKTDNEPNQINIVYIMCDDHAFQAISAYGHPISQLAPTPNIDRLAKAGMLFTRAYVENSISSPSRATLLTGVYSHMHGQTCLTKTPINNELITFPELLQKNGYQTAVIGKWHLPIDPKGFDYYKILDEQGFYYNPDLKTKDTEGKYVREEGYITHIIGKEAIAWLEARDRQKPFCLMVHHKAPHRNWWPEKKYMTLYDDVEFPYPETLFDDYATRSDAAHSQDMAIKNTMTIYSDLKVWDAKPHSKKDPVDERPRMTEEQLKAWTSAYMKRNKDYMNHKPAGDDLTKWKYQQYLKDYLRCVKSVDDQVGELLDYLEANGLMDNTLIVYTSDQGFYMGEHGWFDKRFMYEESFRTPLIMAYPRMIQPGSICKELVQNIDYAPTFLDLAGIDIPTTFCGVSLRPLFKTGKAKNWRNDLYYHYYDYPAIHMVRRHDGVITKDFKLIHFYGKGFKKDLGNDIDAWEFYDLRKDSTEVNNVYDDRSYRKRIEQLKARLETYRKELSVPEY